MYVLYENKLLIVLIIFHDVVFIFSC